MQEGLWTAWRIIKTGHFYGFWWLTMIFFWKCSCSSCLMYVQNTIHFFGWGSNPKTWKSSFHGQSPHNYMKFGTNDSQCFFIGWEIKYQNVSVMELCLNLIYFCRYLLTLVYQIRLFSYSICLTDSWVLLVRTRSDWFSAFEIVSHK